MHKIKSFFLKPQNISRALVGVFLLTIFSLVFGQTIYAQFDRTTGDVGWGYGNGFGYGSGFGVNDGSYRNPDSSSPDQYVYGYGYGNLAADAVTTSTIHGVVRDSHGNTLSGIELDLYLVGSSNPPIVAHSDGSGNYNYPDLTAGNYQLNAYANYVYYSNSTNILYPSVLPGQTVESDFTFNLLLPWVTNGNAITVSKTQVALFWETQYPNAQYFNIYSSADGFVNPIASTTDYNYTVNSLTSGSQYSFQVLGVNAAGQGSGGYVIGRTYSQTGALQLTVTDGAVPLTGVNVDFKTSYGNTANQTGIDGVINRAELPSGESIELTIQKNGYVQKIVTTTLVANITNVLNVSLDLAGAMVVNVKSGPTCSDNVWLMYGGIAVVSSSNVMASTTFSGNPSVATFSGLLPGTYDVVLPYLLGYAPTSSIEVVSGGATTTVNLCVGAGQYGAIEGNFVDSNGMFISNGTVVASRSLVPPQNYPSANINGNIFYQLPGLDSGFDYTITASVLYDTDGHYITSTIVHNNVHIDPNTTTTQNFVFDLVTTTASAPTNLLAATTSLGRQILLTWDPVENQGVTSYRIYSSADNYANYLSADAKGPSSITVGSLQFNTLYTFHVVAHNIIGDSSSTTVSITTDPAGPNVPTGLLAAPISGSEIDLSWNQVSGATSYNIYRMNDGISVDGATFVTSTVSYFSNQITGLSSSGTYHFRLSANTPAGESDLSDVVSANTPYVPLTAPTGLVASSTSRSEIDLSWNQVSGADGYYVYINYSPAPSYIYTNYQSSYQITNLISNTAYTFSVAAYGNNIGVGPNSTEVIGTTLSAGPNVPTNLIATPVSDNRIDLSWSSIPSATEYRLYTDCYVVGLGGCTYDTSFTNGFQKTGLNSNQHRFEVASVVNGSQSDVSDAIFSSPLSPSNNIVHGTVTYNGTPISGATVSLNGGAPATVQTDSFGNYSLSYLTDGTYSVSVSATGYAAYTSSLFSVSGGQNHQENVFLTLSSGSSSHLISMFPASSSIDAVIGATNTSWTVTGTLQTDLHRGDVMQFVFPTVTGTWGLSHVALATSSGISLYSDIGIDSTNLFNNPSFENDIHVGNGGDPSVGWVAASMGGSGWGSGSSSFGYSTSSYVGNTALEMKVAGDGSSAIAVQGKETLTPGQNYTFSYYAKGNPTGNNLGVLVNMNGVSSCSEPNTMYIYNFNNHTWNCALGSDVLAPGSPYINLSGVLTGEYQRFNGTFTASTSQAYLNFIASAPNTSVLLDAVKLEVGSTPTNFMTNILDNPSFASGTTGWEGQTQGTATASLYSSSDYSGDNNINSLKMMSGNTASDTAQILALKSYTPIVGYDLAINKPHTLSFYAKGNTSNDIIRVSLINGMNDNGAELYDFNSNSWITFASNTSFDSSSSSPYIKDFSLSNEFGRKSLNFITPTDTTSTILSFVVGGTDNMYHNNSVYLDAVQLEPGSVSSTFSEDDVQGALLVTSTIPNNGNKLYAYVANDISSSTPFSFTFSGINNPSGGSVSSYDSIEFGVAAGAYVVNPYEDLAGGSLTTTTISLQPQGGKSVCIQDPSKPNDSLCFWDTPAEAMPFMQSGFTMTIASGTYDGFTVNVSGVNIEGVGPDCPTGSSSTMCRTNVVIDAKGGEGIVLDRVSNVIVTNLTVKNANGQKTVYVLNNSYFNFGGQDYNVVNTNDFLTSGSFLIVNNILIADNKGFKPAGMSAYVSSTDISLETGSDWSLGLIDLNAIGPGFYATAWFKSSSFPDRAAATELFRTMFNSSTFELSAWATSTLVYNQDGTYTYNSSTLEGTGIYLGGTSPEPNIKKVDYVDRTYLASKHPYSFGGNEYSNKIAFISGIDHTNNVEITQNNTDVSSGLLNSNPGDWNLALISSSSNYYTVYVNSNMGINSQEEATTYFNRNFSNDSYNVDFWATSTFEWDAGNGRYVYYAPEGPVVLETYVSGTPYISASTTAHAGVKFINSDNGFFLFASSTNNNYGVWFSGTSTKNAVIGLGYISSSTLFDLYSDSNASDPNGIYGATPNNIVSSSVNGTNPVMFADVVQIHVVDINGLGIGKINVDVTSAGGEISHQQGTTDNRGDITNISLPVFVKTSTTTYDWSSVNFAATATSTFSAASTTVTVNEFNQNVTIQMLGQPPYGFPPSALTVGSITTSTVDLTLVPDGNPATTTYAIYDAAHQKCVVTGDILGNCDDTVLMKTIADWHTEKVTGLTPDTNYAFGPVMIFGEGVFGTTTPVHTNAIIVLATPAAVTIGVVTTSTIDVTLNSDANPTSTVYTIYDAVRGVCVYSDGTLGSCDATPAVHTIADWGTETIVGLDSNAQYQLSAVVAYDGPPLFGPTTSVFTSSSVPASLSVSNVSALGVTLTWDRNNNSTSTNYEIYGAGFTTITAQATTTADLSGLTPSTEYTFYVRAQNAFDTSTYSDSISITTTTLSPTPNDPSGLFVNQITTSTAVINWTSGHGGEDTFYLEFSHDGVDYNDYVTTSAAVSSFAIARNNPNMQMFIRLSAVVDGYATSSAVTSSFYSSSTDPFDPAVTNISTSTAILAWGENNNPVTTTYQVAGNNGFATFDVVNATTTILSNLIPNNSYTFTVRSKNHDGSLNKEEIASATTTQAVVPGIPTAVANGQTSMIVSWNSNLNSTGTIYQLYNYTNSAIVATTTATSYTVSGLTANTSYRFNVRAQNKFDNLTYTDFSSTSTAVSTAAVGSFVTIILNTSASSTFQLTDGDSHIVTLISISNGTATLNFASTPFSVSLQTGQSSNNVANGITVTMNSVGSGSAQFTLSAYTAPVVSTGGSSGGGSGAGGGSIPPSFPPVLAPAMLSQDFSVTGSTHVVIGNVSHKVQVDKIDLVNNQVTFTIESTPLVFTLKVNEEKVLDTNGDKENDIRVKLNSISAENKTVNLTIVSIADLQFTINHFDLTTSDRNVTLYFNSPEAKQVAISESADFKDASYVTYQKTMKWKLSAGDGFKMLYARLRTAAGGTKIVRSTIILQGSDIESVAPVSAPSVQFVFKKNLSYGTVSNDVKQLQMVLKDLGYYTFSQFTTKFGVSTRDAVKAFQKANNINPVNGMVGPLTRTALNSLTSISAGTKIIPATVPVETTKFVFKKKLSFGNVSNDVKQLQIVLKERGFFTYPQFTTRFGAVTRDAVKAFQKANDILPINGVVSSKTIEALNNLP